MKKININFIKKSLSALLIGFMVLSNGLTFAVGNVSPDVNETISVGGSYDVVKEVITPEIPPKLDLLFLVDTSGSYFDDLVNIKGLSDQLFDDLSAGGTDLEVAVASFRDYPFAPWGSGGDYPFNLDLDFTTSKAAWTGAIDSLTAGGGGNLPESQYTALSNSATGATWRTDSKRVIVITTDASFNEGGGYPGPSSASTITLLNDEEIIVIGLKAPIIGPDVDSGQIEAVALATGGSTLPTLSDSSDIADAILEGLGNLPITVIPDASACSPLDITFNPSSDTLVSGGTAIFDETITVPNNPDLQGTEVHCQVIFEDEDGNEIGVQDIWVRIPDETPPELSCEATTNPHGKNIPKAGVKSKGQNEDGFYQLFGSDNVDGEVEIFVNGFGPFMSGDKVKITEAPGVTPIMKKMGSGNGNAGAIAAHLILDTDATVTATDLSLNTTSVVCLVPPMPK